LGVVPLNATVISPLKQSDQEQRENHTGCKRHSIAPRER
jgi:hypothetical protein